MTQLTNCSQITGQCACIKNAVGLKCGQCQAGLFLNGSYGCVPCNCEECLSVPSTICDGKTGQCACRSGLTGSQCDEVSPGNYLPFLDGIIYEAEEAILGGNASIQTRTPDAKRFTGSGVVRLEDDRSQITFYVTVPPFSIRYELLIRYQAAADTSSLKYNITGTNFPDSVFTRIDEQSVVPADFDNPITFNDLGQLAENTQLTVNIKRNLLTPGEILIDSVVLFPDREDVPAYQALFPLTFEADDCYESRVAVPDYEDPLSEFCLHHTRLASACIFNGAVECNCNVDGSNSSVCEPIGGQCSCRENVVGRRCFACKHSFFNFPVCEACDCNAAGSVDEGCDSGGQCSCLPEVQGLKCDECQAGFFFNASNPSVCQRCDCDECLSHETRICDGETGQCLCRIGLQGSDCTIVQPDRYLPFLDGIVYEAEKATLAGNASIQTRPSNSELFTGTGVVKLEDIGDQVTFDVTVPPISIEYNLLVRYQAADEVDRLSFTVGGTECPDTEFTVADDRSAIVNDFTEIQEISLGCLVGNTQLTVEIRLESSLDEIFIDSIVLFPERDQVPPFPAFALDSPFEGPDCYNSRRAVPNHADSLAPVCLAHTLLASSCIFNGTLDCNCDPLGANSTECESIGGQCTCRPNVIGRTCSDCAFNHTNLTSSGCQPCDCFAPGTRSDLPCNPVTGNCSCKVNYVGSQCDMCDVNFFNTSMCQPCGCNFTFSASLQCSESGICSCLPGIAGIKCEGGCNSEFFNLTSSGCTPCECNSVGSIDSSCDVITGQCKCRSGVIGRKCDQCINPGFFGFGEFEDIACKECFCNERTNSCKAAHQGAKIETSESVFDNDDDNWTGQKTDGTPSGAVAHINIDGRNALSGFTVAGLEFFVAPAKFLGDQSASYGQKLTFDLGVYSLSESSEMPGLASNPNGDVILRKANSTVPYSTRLPFRPNLPLPVESRTNLTSYEIQLVEWNFVELPGSIPVSKVGFLDVLSDLGSLQIRANFGQSTESTVGVLLDDVVLTRLVNASAIENCSCPAEYAGPSCQFCAAGFKREIVGGNASIACVPCQCNDHSNVCDSDTGICINCTDNTKGDFCEKCQEEFFGNATKDNEICQPCSCNPDGSSSLICDQVTGKCDCKVGFSGRTCDDCADGFFNKSAGCLMCQCNTTNTINGSDVCDKLYGRCPCVSGVAGRTCDQCRQTLLGSPPSCVDCGLCFSNWTGLIDRLLCDGVEPLAGGIDRFLQEVFQVSSRLFQFVRCVKKEVATTADIVEECIAEIAMMIDDGAIENFERNITELRQKFDRLCDQLNDNFTYIEHKAQMLETDFSQLESEKQSLETVLSFIGRLFNATETLFAETRFFNGTVRLPGGRSVAAEELEMRFKRLNESSAVLERELEINVTARLSQIQADRTRISVSEEKALRAQESVRGAVHQVQEAKYKIRSVNGTKANFSFFHDENVAKKASLYDESHDVKDSLRIHFEKAENATRQALAANETATKAGNLTQEKYFVALASKSLADELKTNASLALEQGEKTYHDSLRERAEARKAYLAADLVVNDTFWAKEKLENTVEDVLDAEHYANQTLQTQLRPVSDVETFASQINDSAANIKEDLVKLNASAYIAKQESNRARQSTYKAMDASRQAEALVDGIVDSIGEAANKTKTAEKILADGRTSVLNAVQLTVTINNDTEEVHAMSQESVAISSAAEALLATAALCREKASGDLSYSLGRASKACNLTDDINQDTSDIATDTFAIRNGDALADAKGDQAVANELFQIAQEKESNLLNDERIEILRNLVDEVTEEKWRLEGQKNNLASLQARMKQLELKIEQRCTEV